MTPIANMTIPPRRAISTGTKISGLFVMVVITFANIPIIRS